LNEESEGVQRNEVNFWNGKVSSMRKDLEQQ